MSTTLHATIAALVLAVFCQSGLAQTAGNSSAREYSIEDFLDTTNYQGASFSPDKSKILVSSDASGIYNAYAISLQDGTREQLTDSSVESVFTMGYFPQDERFLYSSDEGGNELDHVFVRNIDGTSKDLTPGKDFKAGFLGWALDDKSFFIGTTERDQRFFDVYEYEPVNFTRKMIYQNNEGYDFADITPDRNLIALTKVVSNDDTDIYLYNRETKESKLITVDEEPVDTSVQGFSRDGKHLYYTTNKGHEFAYLVRHDVSSGETEEVLRLNWDIVFSYFSRHGTYLVVGINNDASTELRMYNAKAMQRVELPKLADANITTVGISRDEQTLSFYASSSRMPRDLFVHQLDSEEPPKQLTRSLSEKIDADDLVDGKVVRFSSYDGLEIPGILYRPKQATAENKVPAVVSVHGGPGGQSRIGYSALTQYLVNHGYTVYAINNRGSSGYGKTFFHLDDRRHGDADLDDVVASKEMLAALDYVDGKRIGIMGGSYGGYMTLAALTFRPQAFEVGVDIFGISNWHRTVKNIPPWWESFRVYLEKEMGDFDDEEFFKAKSPLFHAKNIQKPLMVLQGANDPRVLKVESDEIVSAARANGVPVEYIVFEDEGHGFVKKANQVRGYQGVLKFLDEHLR